MQGVGSIGCINRFYRLIGIMGLVRCIGIEFRAEALIDVGLIDTSSGRQRTRFAFAALLACSLRSQALGS